MEPVFDNAGIARRHIVKPTDWYHGDHGWKARNQVYLEAAETLYVDAAQKALDRAGIAAADVDFLVTVSTTGITTPSLEAPRPGRIVFRHVAEKVLRVVLGCAGRRSGPAPPPPV